jgi:hypothetical protein
MRVNRVFHPFFCSLDNRMSDFEGIYNRAIINPVNGNRWQGDYDCWDKLLSEFPFTLDKEEVDKSGLDNSVLG